MFHETQLRFVGKNEHSGLQRGCVYKVQIFMNRGRLCVELPSNQTFGNRICTYDSLTELSRQWVDAYAQNPLTMAELLKMDGDVVQDAHGIRYIVNIGYINPHTHRRVASGIDMNGDAWTLDYLVQRRVFLYKATLCD